MKKTLLILSLLLPTLANAQQVSLSRVIAPMDATEDHPTVGHTNRLHQVLYVFDIDKNTENGSACNNACAEKWPPVLLTNDEINDIADDGTLGVITRDSGLKQLTINNRPVYTFYKDKDPLHANGHGLGSVWHISQQDSE